MNARHLDPRSAVASIPNGSTIVVAPACGTPTTLLHALAAHADGRGWTLMSGLLLDPSRVVAAVERKALRYHTWHPTRPIATKVAAGEIGYIPIRASQVPKQFARWNVDVALVRVTPPDRHGWCSLGPSASYSLHAIDQAAIRIAEVDQAMPRTWGQTMVHRSRFDAMVESSDPMPVYEAGTPDHVSRAIARHLIELLPDRPILQLGIGAVPEALVVLLGEHGVGELRFVGMGSDGMAALARQGLLDTRPSALPPIAAPDLLGTAEVMAFADDNPCVGVYPSTVVHAPTALAQLDRLVSINSAVEVDLGGHVNSERLRGRQISGVGGSVDFFEGATHSAVGVRAIALPATTPDGSISRIVARLGEDSAVSLPPSLVDVVVTEHGVARLEGLTARQRAEALISIAAPAHHDALENELAAGAAVGR